VTGQERTEGICSPEKGVGRTEGQDVGFLRETFEKGWGVNPFAERTDEGTAIKVCSEKKKKQERAHS